MAIVVVEDKLTKEDFEKAREDYKIYIKITIDLKKETVVLGGEYHADAEKLLLERGSRQENIWGGGVNLETGNFETNAIINLRRGNNSTEILDPEKRKEFLRIVRRVLREHVKQRKFS
ncbi:hypothetical protein A2865_02715 [Candidatus Woesebacteria bacterium RIFCSPHIGHO2_01_FULL_39_17]|uniref:Uncharacterized protein n=3 Tax=Candidatus Woeseibacteriota TaxID=1752722 RepID=A0A0G0NAW7_9BACT|nr:MAG: hypothetical protein US72_C0004G0077 [Microgenomates group bacterium GW2011_GWC1_38_12]KKQ93368.1 MAG: hypothetical protein UT19_C0013G0032 [Candidatus Woesebacteria bacterium GW2011_GWB1_39_10b]KKR13294.1 MAG: hypothetical protein UT40_C0020G0015 [Candidatus Woesebacteria bacterium GW2011_GWA1_39_21b]OGM23216.1 MAG: hypothetical protein A2865_02715 [Candidatus Woesebacteria bacterium RIFCSPHIGHO2_01_FULL_39_17]OGM61128.1 MAG: hypothetical protein A3A52_04020 [Candidatus Woesebacteria b